MTASAWRDVLAPLGYAATEACRGRRPGRAQHLPHPREGGREGLFRARPPARAAGASASRRRAAMIIAVAGCVAQAEGEEIVAPRARRRPGRRAADLSPAAGADRAAPAAAAARGRDRFPGRGQVRRAAGADRSDARARRHRLPDGAGRLRQVLHLLRRALHARRRILAARRQIVERRRAASRRRACARSRCSARTSTPIAAPGRTGGGWSLAELLGALAGIDGLERLRYTTSHPRDMDDDLIAAHRRRCRS